MLHLNDHLYSKPCVFFLGSEVLGSHRKLRSLLILSRDFSIGYIYITKNNKAFTRGGIYPYLLLPDTYFHFHVYNRVTLLNVVPLYRAHPIKHQMLIITMHSHPFHAMSPCICNAMCHFMPIPCHIYDECYMDNSTHAYHPCIMDNYINQHEISKQSHISCQHICTHINQHQQVITNQVMTYFIL